MSNAFDEASVVVAVADYVGADTNGKVNAIGMGFSVTPIQASGLTNSMYVLAMIELPASFNDQDAVVSLELRNTTEGRTVTLPGTTEAFRITQQVRFVQKLPGGIFTGRDVSCRASVVLAFPAGLPLDVGKNYSWKLHFDGQSRKSWAASFHVQGAPPAVVLGGPTGAADIPNIQPTDTAEPDDA